MHPPFFLLQVNKGKGCGKYKLFKNCTTGKLRANKQPKALVALGLSNERFCMLTGEEVLYKYIYIMPLAPLEGQGHITIKKLYIEARDGFMLGGHYGSIISSAIPEHGYVFNDKQ